MMGGVVTVGWAGPLEVVWFRALPSLGPSPSMASLYCLTTNSVASSV